MAGRKLVFPTPANCKLKHGAALCTAERVIGLYNQENGTNRQRITDSIKEWFAEEVLNHGWAGGHFLPEAQSGHGAGCVMFMPPQKVNVAVNVTEKTLVLVADK
jgi:hypothetical protein